MMTTLRIRAIVSLLFAAFPTFANAQQPNPLDNVPPQKIGPKADPAKAYRMEIVNGDQTSVIYHPKNEATAAERKSLENLAKFEEEFANKGIKLAYAGTPETANSLPLILQQPVVGRVIIILKSGVRLAGDLIHSDDLRLSVKTGPNERFDVQRSEIAAISTGS